MLAASTEGPRPQPPPRTQGHALLRCLAVAVLLLLLPPQSVERPPPLQPLTLRELPRRRLASGRPTPDLLGTARRRRPVSGCARGLPKTSRQLLPPAALGLRVGISLMQQSPV